jgi:hypothetical protein
MGGAAGDGAGVDVEVHADASSTATNVPTALGELRRTTRPA